MAKRKKFIRNYGVITNVIKPSKEESLPSNVISKKVKIGNKEGILSIDNNKKVLKFLKNKGQ